MHIEAVARARAEIASADIFKFRMINMIWHDLDKIPLCFILIIPLSGLESVEGFAEIFQFIST
mgnify:CR=1 FL=1